MDQVRRQGKSDKAELYGTVLGPEHPGMLASMNNLAAVLGRQGKYDEAEAIHRQELGLIEMVMGPEQTIVEALNARASMIIPL